MTDILCNWLNNEVRLTRKVDNTNFGTEFSTGYLIGEVLAKYQLQDDFDQFSQSKTADSKLNNFTRLEPVLHLLEIPFDTNVARDVMTEQHGVATRLMYQLFIALNKKQKNNLTGVAMETMRPAAPVKLEGVESKIYKERLKHMTPRQTDLNLDALVDRFHQKQIAMEKTAFKERFEEQERYDQEIQNKRQELIQKYRDQVTKRSEMLAKIQAATVHIPKPPPNKTAKAIAARRQERKMKEAKAMEQDLDQFEEKLKRTLPPSKPVGDDEDEVAALPDSLDLIKPSSNNEYIGKIRKRLNEDANAREEREKRRRKVLVDQMKAHEAQEEARREEMLVNRLMRQSQQERRIAVQLLQARHEKDTIRKNRLMREKQYEERRLAEFEEALNREAEMARLARLEYIEQTQQDRELHNQIMAERAKERYERHYDMCSEVLSSIVDFSTKIGEYRELTNKLLPPKLMRDWTSLFVSGMPMYEVTDEVAPEVLEPTPEQILEEERQHLLNEGDFQEYRNMIGEWQPPENSEIPGPPRNNPIVGHIVQRLFDIVNPPTPPPPPPEFPEFPIKACVVGKVFSGKSSCVQKIADYHRLQVLSAEDLVAEAVEAHKNNEMTEIEESAPPTRQSDQSEVPATATPSGPPQSGAPPTAASEKPPSVLTEVKSGVGSKPGSAAPDNREADEAPPSSAAPPTGDKDDGMEKSDPEKPVPPEEDQQEVASNPMATPRAKLGAKAMKLLKRGKPIDDALTVEILIEAIKRIPEGTGWVMDGFPNTYNQAKLLEKAISGYEAAQSRESSQVDLKNTSSKVKMRQSQLAPDPKPAPPPKEQGSGINVVILFDLENELCLKRSAGRTQYQLATAEEQGADKSDPFHQEFKPPPEGSATGVGNQQKVVPVDDIAHDQEQIQHRLTSFSDAWPKLEKWYNKFGNLRKVDAAQPIEAVYLEVEDIMEQIVKQLQGGDIEESLLLDTETKEEEKEPEKQPEPAPEPPKEEPPKEERSRPSSKKGSRSGSAKRSGSRGSADKKKGSAKSSKDSGKKSARASSGSKSPKRGKSGKGKKTPEPEPEPEPEVPPGTPPPQPGSDLWEYVDQPIDPDMAEIIAPQWENLETKYINADKCVFRKIRGERENIIQYLYSIRQNFLSYLRRPDNKQEFISQWQKDFNELSDDIREDDETRAELHQTVDDLRERLWTICDTRKEQAEGERQAVIEDGWLDDRLGLLTNHYITLMQSEADRFQDTTRMLKDYYRGMEGKIPDEQALDYIRIPLVELPVTELAESVAGSQVDESPASPLPDDNKSTTSKTGTPKGKGKGSLADDSSEGPPQEEKRQPKIPLVPRRPASPDPNAKDKGKDKAKGKGKEDELAPPPEDPDEKHVYDGHAFAYQAIDKIIAAEQAAKEAEEVAEREREALRELEKQKAAAATKGKGKDKKGKKSRSPSPKKGGKGKTPPPTTPPPPQMEESEEDKEKKLVKERARQEFFAAIQEECIASKVRLDLIKAVAIMVLQRVKSQSDMAYNDMNDWLGARFLKEMESIDQMSEIMRNAVESGEKVKEELILEQEEFVVDQEVRVLRTPSPQPRPPPMEVPTSDVFTVDQVKQLYNQFSLTAPSGLLSIKAFQEVMSDLTTLTHGMEEMPDICLNLTPDKLELISQAVSPDGEYIDWRMFLLAASQPWPSPTQTELLQALEGFREMDQKNTGYVSREQFDRVALWFGDDTKPTTPENPSEPMPFDRLSNLKRALFDIFGQHDTNPPQLDYTNMLLYFSQSPDAYEGVLRALSVASNTHMPRLPKKIDMKKPSRPSSQASMVTSVDMETERVEERVVPDDIPEDAVNAKVSLDALVRVLKHGQTMRGDSNRFSGTSDSEDVFSKERLSGVFQELGSDDASPISFSTLIEHPVIQDVISVCNTYRAVDLKTLFTNPPPENVDTQSMKTE